MDMPGISPDIICHRLSIDPKTKPVRQKRRSYDAERYEAMKAEVEKLKGIGFVREVNYPTWVAYVVLVKKNLTKESFLLQKVLLIDSTAGSFTTDRGLYCYKGMEVYFDDMLVKSKHADQHITNLSETFTILKRYRMGLNPNKCAFGVGFGKFLGFMISQRGIEANPEKIKTIIDMKEPGSKKYITWTDECAEAFKNLKEYMSKAPMLSKPEVDGNVERPVYYASKALQDAETRYSNIEKLALALILQSPDTSGRMIKWAITLGEFDISYQPKLAEKGQAVADFIADFTYPIDIVFMPKEVVSLPLEGHKIELTATAWSLYVDGSSNQQGCGAELILTTLDKVAMKYALRFKFKASNNKAEYEALLTGLRLAEHLGVKQIDIFSDSQLVVNQVTNNFDAKDSSMAAYLAQT
ncbi:hypothetical protein ACFX2B_040193 [Malus domestica]